MLSLIIPVYKNEASLEQLLEALTEIDAGTPDELEVVFVIDRSPDQSYATLREALPERVHRSQLILLSRNFGSFAAIRAGLAAGKGDRFAVMAADLQEPPDVALRMDEALRTQDVDVVLGVREGRADPTGTRLASRAFWSSYKRLVVPDMPAGGVDVFACSRRFRDELLRLDESHSSLIAQLFWVGFERAYVGYSRVERQHGRSAWTLRKRFGYLSDSLFSFTDLPIKLLVWLGGLVAVLSGAYAGLIAILRLAGIIDVPGFTMVIILIVFFGSLNLFALGILGSYAWRAYENTKARPLHIVDRTHEFDGNADKT